MNNKQTNVVSVIDYKQDIGLSRYKKLLLCV